MPELLRPARQPLVLHGDGLPKPRPLMLDAGGGEGRFVEAGQLGPDILESRGLLAYFPLPRHHDLIAVHPPLVVANPCLQIVNHSSAIGETALHAFNLKLFPLERVEPLLDAPCLSAARVQPTAESLQRGFDRRQPLLVLGPARDLLPTQGDGVLGGQYPVLRVPASLLRTLLQRRVVGKVQDLRQHLLAFRGLARREFVGIALEARTPC